MEESILKLYHENFSIVTTAETKQANFPWKASQTARSNWDSFLKNWRYKGGTHRRDGTEIPATKYFAICTGFEDLEVLDIDLKVFNTAKEQKEFWEGFIKDLNDNIYDFDEKFVIYKTKNAGYHILYKTKLVEGNQKIAKLKGHDQCVFETRGRGGYVLAYPENKVSKKNYFQIQYISDDDREILFSFARMYDFIENPIEVDPVDFKAERKNKVYEKAEITPWDDFNQQTKVWDIISDEFTIFKDLPEKYVIKRHGTKNPWSGYIFKDSNKLFMWSTGTRYEAEQAYTAFMVYAIRYHNKDIKAAIKDLYNKGFGSRYVEKEHEPVPLPKDITKIEQADLVFPIDIFPKPIQGYILDCHKTLDSSIDYMGCSMVWVASLVIGNSMQVEVKRGWREIATIWVAIVGKAGIGKTPSINNILFPLEKVNNKLISDYIKEYQRWEEHDKLTKKEQKDLPEVPKPRKKQFIANDITVEALVDLHEHSDNGVGVFKDELAGWFKDMNKYKQGSDLEFWLSCWSGKAVNLNRITRVGSFVSNPLIPVLGGIQPAIFSTFYTDENKDNGFVDRILLSYPDLSVEKYNDEEMKAETIDWFYNAMVSFYQTVQRTIKRNEDGKIDPTILIFSPEAKKEWIRIFNNITNTQNSDDENEYMKSMLPKQKSYIPRFAMLIHVLNAIGNTDYKLFEISKDSMLKAEKLSNYFIAMAKKIKVDTMEVETIKSISRESKGKTPFEKFKAIYSANKEFNKKEVSELLGVSRNMIYKYIEKLEKK